MSREEITEIAKELLFIPRNELIKILIKQQQEKKELKEQLEKEINKKYLMSMECNGECKICDYYKDNFITNELENWLMGAEIMNYNVDGKVAIIKSDVLYKLEELKKKIKF